MHRGPSFLLRHALRFTDSQGGSLADNEKSLRKKGERKSCALVNSGFLGKNPYLLSERRAL
jgi:hypothetical protein